MKPIRKAIFPVAGLGTRFLPATKASPKEMLPVVDKPLIQYAVEEAYEAGIRHMIFVTGRTKRSVEDHFDTAYELESELAQAGKTELLNLARSIAPEDMVCSYVRQPRALGLGHAVLCAQPLVGEEPFAVLLADEPVASLDPATAVRVLELVHRICKDAGIAAVVSLHQVDLAKRFADRVIGVARGRVVFDDVPARLDAAALHAVYGDLPDETATTNTTAAQAKPAAVAHGEPAFAI